MLLLFLGLLLATDNQIKVETQLVYEQVPADQAIMVGVSDLVMDAHDNLYVLDVDARKIFCWDKDGKFTHAFGRAGNGPGEFAFDPDYRYFINMTLLDDQLLILNSLSRKLSYFKTNGEFVKDVHFPGDGQVKYFEANKSGNLLVMTYNYYTQGTPKRDLYVYDRDLKLVRRIASYKVENLIPRYHNGTFLGFRLHAFKPDTWVYTAPNIDGALVGPQRENEFELYDGEGKRKSIITLDLPQIDIPEQFMSEFKESLRNHKYLEINYADKLPYYDTILPVKEYGYYVANSTSETRTYFGNLVSYEGKNLGPVTIVCGDLGMIDAPNDYFIIIDNDEETDNYHIRRVKFVVDNLR